MENNKDIIVLKDIPFKADVDAIIKLCAMDDEELQSEIAEFTNEAESLAKPKAILKLVNITHSDENKVIAIAGKPCINSTVLNKNLSEINEAVAYVVSCGIELDSFDCEYDPLKEYWLDLLKLQALGTARKAANEKIKEMLSTESIAHLNPGSLPQWPISEQPSLFGYIGNVEENIGVKLSSSHLMTPLKSSSGLAYKTEKHYENCMICKNLDCPNRRAPFNEMMADEYSKESC